MGGGPVLNICLMVGANYSAKESMSITYIFLMGGATASIIKNYGKLQPSTQTFIVDYDLIIITLPMVATGSIFGVTISPFADARQPLPFLDHCNSPLRHCPDLHLHKYL